MAAYEYWRIEIQFTAGVWTDVTSDVDGSIRATNGATAETTGEPASLSLVLHNPGFKYTPGNTNSATALATGMPIRFFEVILDQYIYHFTGFIEFPEIGSVNLSMTQTQTISVTAIDQLSAWERSGTFISTLGAHIKGSVRNDALFGYWPLTDAALPFADIAGSTPAVETILASTLGNVEQFPHVEVRTGENLPGDDALPVLLVPGLNAGAVAWNVSVDVDFDLTTSNFPVLAAGQVLTAVIWTNRRSDYPVISGFGPLTLAHSDGIVSIQLNTDPAGDYFRITSPPVGSLSGNVSGAAGSAEATDRYYAIGMRFGFTPNILELWVDDTVYTATLSGVLAGPLHITGISGFAYGSIAHMQLYVGASTDFTNADFLAQRQVGLTGLGRQTTGDRIKTLAHWAGKTDGQLVNVDTGCSIMQPASLAGLTVAQAMAEARETEQGDLYVDGTGALTFHDRRTIYNI